MNQKRTVCVLSVFVLSHLDGCFTDLLFHLHRWYAGQCDFPRFRRQTVIGSAALAESDGATPAATLRQNVTRPGGTTEAALKILMSENGLTDLMTRAIQAAQKRGKELAHENKYSLVRHASFAVWAGSG